MVLTFLEEVKDFRRAQGRRYELKHILLFSIMAVLSNSKSYRDISRFITIHYDRLQKEFGLSWKSPPGYTTIRNIIQGIDKKELESSFRAYTSSLLDSPKEKLSIAIDGKTLCGSYDHFVDQKAIQNLMFFEVNKQLVLGHIPISDKSNEIPSAQKLLKELSLDGVFTLDAIHCQKKLFKQQKKKH